MATQVTIKQSPNYGNIGKSVLVEAKSGDGDMPKTVTVNGVSYRPARGSTHNFGPNINVLYVAYPDSYAKK